MYEALVSFSGVLQMRKGEVKAITDKKVVADLLRAGYIKEVKTAKEKTAEKPKEVKETKPKTAKPKQPRKRTAKKK